MLSQNAKVVALDGDTLTIGLVNAGARDSFASSGSSDILADALREVLGVAWKIDAVIDPSASGADAAPPASPAEASPPKPRTTMPDSVRQAAEGAAEGIAIVDEDDPDAAAHPDDPVVDADLDPEQLLASELGAQVIDEKS
jgi:DNA polymerase-3 subunit gamma/tau